MKECTKILVEMRKCLNARRQKAVFSLIGGCNSEDVVEIDDKFVRLAGVLGATDIQDKFNETVYAEFMEIVSSYKRLAPANVIQRVNSATMGLPIRNETVFDSLGVDDFSNYDLGLCAHGKTIHEGCDEPGCTGGAQ